jgi:hypothetical protein
MFKFILIMPALAALISCAVMPEKNQDPVRNNKATYNKDLRDCQEDYPVSGSGIHIRQWIGCMNLKGWK